MINNYTLYNPAKMFFGKGVEEKVGEVVKSYGATKVLLHYDGSEFVKPHVEKAKQRLLAAGLAVYELGGVVANPKLSLMKEGCRMVKENDIDFILAVGGGSTMDSAKYIACGTYYDGELWDHPKFKPITSKVIKHGCIVTMTGTGSETSAGAVWRDDTCTPEKKTFVMASELKFDFAMVNPEVNYTLPAFQTAAGAFDIMSHQMEQYFCAPEDTTYYHESFEAIINEVMRSVRVALKDPTNYSARANLARMAYAGDTVTPGIMGGACVHNLEKPITGIYHRTHGEVLAVFFPYWIKYCYEHDMKKELFIRLCVKCFNAKANYANPDEIIEEGVNNLKYFIKEIGLSTTLKEIGVTDDSKFDECAQYGVDGGTDGYIGRGIKLYKQDIINIYNMALKG